MLNRNSQVGLKIEATEGTEETLAASDYRSNSADHGHNYDPTETDRGLTRGTLTRQPKLKGTRLAEINFSEELVGGSASVAAPWHSTLRAMGFASTGLKKITVGTITNGPYKAGQVIGDNATQASATKTGIFVRMINSTTLCYEPVTGTFGSGDTIYNYATSQASSTASSTASAAGFGFKPLTESDAGVAPSATVNRLLGGEKHTIVASRATGSLLFEVDKPVMLKSVFRGCPVFDPSNPGRPRTGSLVTIPTTGGTPRAVKAMPLNLGKTSGTYAPPVWTQLEVDFGLALADRKTASNQDYAGSGYVAPRTNDRGIVAKLNPEYVIGSVYDYVANVIEGPTFEFNAEIGLPADTNGLVQLYSGQAQMNGKVQPGDRDGITTQDVTMDLCGSQDDELRIWHVFG